MSSVMNALKMTTTFSCRTSTVSRDPKILMGDVHIQVLNETGMILVRPTHFLLRTIVFHHRLARTSCDTQVLPLQITSTCILSMMHARSAVDPARPEPSLPSDTVRTEDQYTLRKNKCDMDSLYVKQRYESNQSS